MAEREEQQPVTQPSLTSVKMAKDELCMSIVGSQCPLHMDGSVAISWVVGAVKRLDLAPRCSGKVGHWASINWVIVSIPDCSLPLN